MTSGPRLTSPRPPFSRDAGARTSNRHHHHYIIITASRFQCLRRPSQLVQWARNQLQCSQRSCARRQRCRKDRHDDSVGMVIRRGQSAIKAARVASPLAWPGSIRFQCACSVRGMPQISVSGGSRGRFVVRVRAFSPPGSVLACCDAFDVALALHVVRHAIRRRQSSVWVCDFSGERAGSAAQCSGEGAGE